MKLEGSEVVEMPLADAWKRINDPAVLKACTPGLQSLRLREDGGYDAVLELKLPAITGRFTGSVEYLERSEPERLRMRVRCKGSPGFVDAEATLDLAETDEGTPVLHGVRELAPRGPARLALSASGLSAARVAQPAAGAGTAARFLSRGSSTRPCWPPAGAAAWADPST